jgi:K+-transporting ATPase ATPase C chain
MWQQILPAFRIAALLTILTGLIYPGIVTALAQVMFHNQANGSLLTQDGRVLGSSLIG